MPEDDSGRGVRYRTFSAYLRERFGAPVKKISLDAGLTCPNRDGTISAGGCIYCDPDSFSPLAGKSRPPLIHQLREGIAAGHGRGVHGFIAYFQSHTNTYAPPEILKDLYDTVRAFPEIKGLAIGTRPDCLDEAVLRLIHSYVADYEVWLELGLQSLQEKSLRWMNRGHDSRAFGRAVEQIRKFPGIKICAHVILGFPGETEQDELEAARAIAGWKLEGIKFHPLYVVKNTVLETEYQRGNFIPLPLNEYAGRVVKFLEHLRPETVIQRLTADCPADRLAAPAWLLDKGEVIRAIQARLQSDNGYQGKQAAEEGLGGNLSI